MWNTGNIILDAAPLLALVATVLLMMPVIKGARLLGVIDVPGGRKQHDRAVPPVGGLVIFPIFIVLALMAGMDIARYWTLLVGIIVLLVMGAIDDRSALPAWVKFWVQVGVACLICFYGDARAGYLGALGFGFAGDGIFWLGWAAYPFTIAAIVLLINAINLMDGLDGLAGGISVVMFIWMIIAALLGGQAQMALMMAILVGALCGFLVFNMRNPWRRKASVFMGDAGSLCLGLVIAWFAIHLAKNPNMPLAPVSVAWIIALPIFDTCAQFYRRKREGKHPFSPDRGHFHHHFVDAGVPVWLATPMIMVIVALMGALGYFGARLEVPELAMLLFWGAALLSHMYISRKKTRYVRMISFFCAKFCPKIRNIEPKDNAETSQERAV